MNNEIKCPHCGKMIDVTASMAKDVKEELEKKYEATLLDLKEGYQSDLNKEKGRMRDYSEKLVKEAAEKAIEAERRKAASVIDDLETKSKDDREKLEEARAKLAESREIELNLRKAQQKLEDDTENLKLEVQRKLDEERVNIKLKITQQIEDEHRLRDMEHEKQMSDMRGQIDDLKHKAEITSQQLAGEVLELDVEEKLKALFPDDTVSEISKGVTGADINQTVCTKAGKSVGTILWETKRTKAWKSEWLKKLKDDQRSAKADIAIIISTALPEGYNGPRDIDGIWVVSIDHAMSLAHLMRYSLIQVSKVADIKAGKQSLAEEVYDYLTSEDFKGRVGAMVEAYTIMKEELDSEKTAITRTWAKREKQLERVALQLSGLHGDLAGICGNKLPGIQTLQLGE